MKNTLFFLITFPVSVLLLLNCNKIQQPKEKNSYMAIANNLLPWITNNNIRPVETGKHIYAFYVDTLKEYSFGFQLNYEQVKVNNFKEIQASCRGLIYQLPSKIQLVIELKKNGNTIFWQSELFEKHINQVNKWGNITFSIRIPDNIDKQSNILVYVWNPSKENALFDSLNISFK